MAENTEELFEKLSPIAKVGWRKVNQINELKKENEFIMNESDFETIGQMVLMNHKEEHKLMKVI